MGEKHLLYITMQIMGLEGIYVTSTSALEIPGNISIFIFLKSRGFL